MSGAPYADLHLHTNYSDGTLTPTELIGEVARLGIRVAAVTDHDILDGLPSAMEEAKRHGVRIIPGVELSSADDGKEVHILGLYIDPENGPFVARLAAFREERLDRGKKMVARLKSLGIEIDYEKVLSSLRSGASMGRPHIARMMVDAGYVSDINQAFDRYLGLGRPAYVGKARLTPAEAIALVHDAGGLAFLAHPGPLRRDDLIPEMRDAGLDGIEAHHSDHDENVVHHYRTMADRMGLLISGGSDFHGTNKTHAPLGSGGLSEKDFLRVEEAAARRGTRTV